MRRFSFLFANPFRGFTSWPWRTNLFALALTAAGYWVLTHAAAAVTASGVVVPHIVIVVIGAHP